MIVGDANRSEVATFLKVGTTAIVLSMIEDDQLPVDLTLANPVGAIRQVSHDPTPDPHGAPARAAGGSRRSTSSGSSSSRPASTSGSGAWRAWAKRSGAEVLRRWEEVLTGLEGDRRRVAGPWSTGWPRSGSSTAYRERHGLEWGDARLRAMDIQYHDLRRRPLAVRPRWASSGCARHEEVERAVTEPPTTTRAYFRGKCLQKWPNDIVAANWDSHGVRRRAGPAAAGPDDGTATWNRGPCG